APAAKYALTGQGEVHGVVTSGATGSSIDATATLKQAAAKLGAEWPAISNFDGKLRLADGKLAIQPSTFMLGASHISLEGCIESFSPLDATYTVGADTVQLADFLKTRPRSDVVNQVSATGTAQGELSSPLVSARARSGNGTLENVAYQNLDTTAAYKAARVSMHPMSAEVFGGSISGNVDAAAGAQPRFDLTLTMRGIDLEQALRSQGLEASHKIRGLLSGNVALAGAGMNWAAIKPTLRGSGRVVLANGKLLGVNIVADAINAVAAAPGVSQLVNVAFMSSHHGLLVDPNTELDAASMTFVLAGPRVTTHDLYAQSPDYTIRGDGWFDTDKNIDMSGDIQLSLGLKVAIPVTVIGKIPAVIVLPDVPVLAGRIAMGAINTPGNVIRGGVNAVGSLVGAGSSAGSSLPSIPNPLDSLKKLLP
ncbi:MAG TPA: AsmA-like C-terminal region-containing protein, partial [Candidatus Acidoferrales bacterium]|nr:AsmA-like C-terminal region-containing protein [Candidatus Acidoferrales bacterium]